MLRSIAQEQSNVWQTKRTVWRIHKWMCKYKGVEIVEGHMVLYHVHLLLSIPFGCDCRNIVNELAQCIHFKGLIYHTDFKYANFYPPPNKIIGSILRFFLVKINARVVKTERTRIGVA